MREISYDVVRKKSCDNKDKLCYHLKPYSSLDIATDKDNSSKEKEQNISKYQNSCKNRDGIIQQCCDKNKRDIEQLDKILKKMGKDEIFGKVEYNKQGALESINVCTEDKLTDCGEGYRKLNAYEMCKIPEDVNLEVTDGKKIDSFTKDCYSSQCNPQERLADINGKFDEEYTYEFDKSVAQAIKDNKLSNLRHYLKEDPRLVDRVLTHSSDGNTVYHEAFKYHAKHIIVFLFKSVSQDIINRLNSKGETLLHIAMKESNPNEIQMCLKLGADINAVNNDNETPIYYAIRNNLYQNVLVCVNYQANLYHKNKKGETPFIIACQTALRDIDIVRLLVDNGANIDDKTTEKKTIIQTLLEKEELQKEKQTPENKEAKEDLNLNIEDEKIRTFLQNIKVKKMGIDLSKELTAKDTQKLEGILYTVINKDDKTNNFTLKIDFDENLSHPDDLHYPKDLKETHIKPHRGEDKDYSHEPYYQKFRNKHYNKLDELKKVIQLTKWDNNKTEPQKLQLIDDIMNGKVSFDTYKYRVMTDNGITIEQEHLLDNIDENSLFELNNNKKEKVQVNARRVTQEDGNKIDKSYDIKQGTDKELQEKNKNQKTLKNINDILTTAEQTEYNNLMNSPSVSHEKKKTLLEMLKELLRKININIDGNQEGIDSLKNEIIKGNNQLRNNVNQVNNTNQSKEEKEQQTLLLVIGIGIAVLVIILLLYLNHRRQLKLKLIQEIKNY